VAGRTGSLSRRGLIAASAALPLARAARAAPVAQPGAWTHDAFLKAMRESGRPIDQSEAQFDAIQARKPAMLKRIESYLKERLGSADPAVMRAFELVPRDYYHYDYAAHRAEPGEAYEDTPKPWAIGYGSALSDYLGQAYMTQIAKPQPGEVTLEIGTGSGFQSSILSRIVKRAYSIEIIQPLGHAVAKIFAPLGYDNVETRVGDGYYGWPEVQGGFDIIMLTCAAQYAPPDLFKQLKRGGRMIIPIGQPFKRGQILYVYTKDAEGKIHSRRDVGVFFIPMTGAMMEKPRPAGPETVKGTQVSATQPATIAAPSAPTSPAVPAPSAPAAPTMPTASNLAAKP
jgi:protein-L-isoaspartate(D-aspartate) O-methyltransferase